MQSVMKTRLLIKFGKGNKLWKRTSMSSFRPGITVDQAPFSSSMVKWHSVTCIHTASPVISKTRLATCRLPTENRALTLDSLLQVGLNSDRDHAHHCTVRLSKREHSGPCPNSVQLARIDGRHRLTWSHKQNVLSSRNHSLKNNAYGNGQYLKV